jgi:hypothetical protein
MLLVDVLPRSLIRVEELTLLRHQLASNFHLHPFQKFLQDLEAFSFKIV